MNNKRATTFALVMFFIFVSSALYSQTDLEKCLTGKWKWHPFNSYAFLKPDGMVGDQKSDWGKWKVTDESKNFFEVYNFAGPHKGLLQKLKFSGFRVIMRQENNFVLAYKEPEPSVTVKTDPPRFFTGYWTPLHPNGKPARSVPFINGVKEGVGQWFYPSGNLQYRTNWSEGKATGEEIEYYDMPGKRMKTSIIWNKGLKNGAEVHYDSAGKVIKRMMWKNNKEVK
ncbi:MAG TPA: hypothetical protein PK293_13420 [Spirochaetota bacterium]|nr:hypothetical protein [Spirochaetota bacterium]